MKGRPDSASVKIVWGVLCIVLFSCLSPPTAYPQETLTLIGHIRTQDGRVLPSGVTVRLETPERMPITTKAPDSEGHFEINGVPSPRCHLIVMAEGFQPYLQDLDWGLSKTVTLSIYLVPINKAKSSPQAVATLTDDNAPKKARKALQEIAAASGGMAFFPESVEDVEAICTQIAHDVRNQYTLAYYPTNTKRDGSFRAVQVEVLPPRGRGKLVARTRNGYFAPGPASAAGTGTGN